MKPRLEPTRPEQFVLDAAAAREVADLSSWPEQERRIRAAFLQDLLDQCLCGILRIHGAEIVGELRPPAGRGEDVAGTGLLFRSCTFDSAVELSGAHLLSLRFIECTLPAFVGASLTTKADLELAGCRITGVTDFEGDLADVGSCAVYLNNARIGGRLHLGSTTQARFHATGTVRLDGARIEGDVSLHGAMIEGRDDLALSARSATVAGNFALSMAHGHRFEALGEVVLAAARIQGDLDCHSARLTNPQGRALHCEDLTVESIMLIGQADLDMAFEASGRLNFLSAIVGGSLFMTSARLAAGPDLPGLLKKGGPVAVNFKQIRISNDLVLSNVGRLDADNPARRTDPRPVEGWFLLTGARLNSILDDPDTGWAAAGYLDIDGATYERINDVKGRDVVRTRVAWLRRQFAEGQPECASFRPQPYEELTRVLRRHGLSNEANAIAVEKIRMRLAARVDRTWVRLFPNLLMLVSHHGYSSARAVTAFAIFVVMGGVFYATALWGFDQTFFPVEGPPEPATYALAFGMAVKTTNTGCPGLDVFHYALDAALPVIDLAQDTRCRFTPHGPARAFWLMLHSLYVIAGAALSAVVVLTLTGVLRRD